MRQDFLLRGARRDPDVEAERLRRRFARITGRFLRSRRRGVSGARLALLVLLAFAVGVVIRTALPDDWQRDLDRSVTSAETWLRQIWP